MMSLACVFRGLAETTGAALLSLEEHSVACSALLLKALPELPTSTSGSFSSSFLQIISYTHALLGSAGRPFSVGGAFLMRERAWSSLTTSRCTMGLRAWAAPPTSSQSSCLKFRFWAFLRACIALPTPPQVPWPCVFHKSWYPSGWFHLLFVSLGSRCVSLSSPSFLVCGLGATPCRTQGSLLVVLNADSGWWPTGPAYYQLLSLSSPVFVLFILLPKNLFEGCSKLGRRSSSLWRRKVWKVKPRVKHSEFYTNVVTIFVYLAVFKKFAVNHHQVF